MPVAPPLPVPAPGTWGATGAFQSQTGPAGNMPPQPIPAAPPGFTYGDPIRAATEELTQRVTRNAPDAQQLADAISEAKAGDQNALRFLQALTKQIAPSGGEAHPFQNPDPTFGSPVRQGAAAFGQGAKVGAGGLGLSLAGVAERAMNYYSDGHGPQATARPDLEALVASGQERLGQMEQPIAPIAGTAGQIAVQAPLALHPATAPLLATGAFGSALDRGKPGAAALLDAGLALIPGSAQARVAERLLPAVRSQALAQGGAGALLGGGMVEAQALGSELSGMPEVAAEERSMALPMAAGMGIFGGAAGALMRPGTSPLKPARPAPEPGVFDALPPARPDIQPELNQSGPYDRTVDVVPGGYAPLPRIRPTGQIEASAPRPGDLPNLNPNGEIVARGGASDLLGLPDIAPNGVAARASRPGMTEGLPDIQPNGTVARQIRGQIEGDLPSVRGNEDLAADPLGDAVQGVDPNLQADLVLGQRPIRTEDIVRGQAPRSVDAVAGAISRRPADVVYGAERRPDDIRPEFAESRLDNPAILDETAVDLNPLPVDMQDWKPRLPPGGSIRQKPQIDPLDEYVARMPRNEASLDENVPEHLDPLDANSDDPVVARRRAEQIGAMGRLDKSLPETQLELDAIRERAQAPTEDLTPVKPGLKGLSPKAQKLIAGLKPGDRAAIQDSIDYLIANPDPQGDAANLEFAVQAAQAKRNPRPKAEPPAVEPEGSAAPSLQRGGFATKAQVAERKAAPPVDLSAETRIMGQAPEVSRAQPQPSERKLAADTFPRRPLPPQDAGAPRVRRADQPATEGAKPSEARPADAPDAGSPREVRGDVAEAPAPNDREGNPPTGNGLNELHGGFPIHPDIRRAASGLVESAARLGKAGLDVWSKRLSKVVEDLPGGKPAAAKARAALDRTREFMGHLDHARQRFLTEMRGQSPRAKAARASFSEVMWDGDVGFGRINDVLDGVAAPHVHELPVLAAYSQAFIDSGRIAEKVGYKIRTPKGEVSFKVDPKRLRAGRVGTEDLYWYVNHPADPETLRLAEKIADVNPGLKPENVLKELEQWSLARDERAVSQRGMAEDARTIERFPTHYVDSEGHEIQLLETDPQRIIDAVTRRFPQRLAYVEQFGQDAVPKELADVARNGNLPAAQDLFRALNGIRTDNPSRALQAKPGSNVAWVAKAAQIPWTALKMAKLSMAPLANAPETLGNARAMMGGFGGKRLMQAGFDMSFLKRGKDQILEELARRGSYTRDLNDWYWNKSDLPETINRYVGTGGSFLNKAVNEFNERVAARMAQMWSKDLAAGNGTAIDKFRLRVLEFTNAERDLIISGKAPKRLYQAVETRAVEWAQGSTSLAADRSKLAGNRYWNLATLADRFSQMNINRTVDVLGKLGATILEETGSKGLIRGAVSKDTLAAVAFTFDLAAGKTAAGAMSLFLRAIAVGGAGGLADKALGSPTGFGDFLIDAARFAFLGGPVQAMANVASGEQGAVAEQVGQMFLPVSMTQEAVDYVRGEGRYRDKDGLEKAQAFLTGTTPIAKAGANVAAVMGLSQDDPKLDAAISAFWKWRAKYAPKAHMEGGEAETSEFRQHMRRANEAIKDGRDPVEELVKAGAFKNRKAIAQSLRGRKLLPKDKLNEIERYLGVETFSKLQMYDNVLEQWARSINPSF